VDDIEGTFGTLQRLIDGLYSQQVSHRSTMSGWLNYLKTLATNVIIEQVNADTPLSSKTISVALTELIRQMAASSDDVDANTVSVTVSTGSANVGNGRCAASVIGPDGKTLEYALAENIHVTATSDSGLGATSGREPFSTQGEAAETDTLSPDWPQGSGASATLTALDAGSTSSSLIPANGDFDTWTTNTPGTWTVDVGSPGTDIFAAGASDDFEGDNALEFTGTGGSPLSGLSQALTISTAAMAPSTVYAFSCWVKKSAGLSAGVLSIALTDGSGTVVNDDAGTANNTTLAHGSMSTSYAHFSGFFRTPKVLPSALRIRVKVTTALTSGESVFVDHLCLARATQAYTKGPYLAVFSGSTAFARGDTFTVAVSNNMGTGAGGEFQSAFERLFGMRSLGLQLPSDAGGTETVADSLIA
jgi:hypothetical protein